MNTETGQLSDEERQQLAEAYHYRYEFEYDQCDHGIGSGDEPYAMCERAFGEESIITAAVASIVASRERAAAEKAWDEGYAAKVTPTMTTHPLRRGRPRNPYRQEDRNG